MVTGVGGVHASIYLPHLIFVSNKSLELMVWGLGDLGFGGLGFYPYVQESKIPGPQTAKPYHDRWRVWVQEIAVFIMLQVPGIQKFQPPIFQGNFSSSKRFFGDGWMVNYLKRWGLTFWWTLMDLDEQRLWSQGALGVSSEGWGECSLAREVDFWASQILGRFGLRRYTSI